MRRQILSEALRLSAGWKGGGWETPTLGFWCFFSCRGYFTRTTFLIVYSFAYSSLGEVKWLTLFIHFKVPSSHLFSPLWDPAAKEQAFCPIPTCCMFHMVRAPANQSLSVPG